jgi:hypothetical protein
VCVPCVCARARRVFACARGRVCAATCVSGAAGLFLRARTARFAFFDIFDIFTFFVLGRFPARCACVRVCVRFCCAALKKRARPQKARHHKQMQKPPARARASNQASTPNTQSKAQLCRSTLFLRPRFAHFCPRGENLMNRPFCALQMHMRILPCVRVCVSVCVRASALCVAQFQKSNLGPRETRRPNAERAARHARTHDDQRNRARFGVHKRRFRPKRKTTPQISSGR